MFRTDATWGEDGYSVRFLGFAYQLIWVGDLAVDQFRQIGQSDTGVTGRKIIVDT